MTSDTPASEPSSKDTRYTEERITAFWRWTPKLFSFRCTRDPAFQFAAGQFARLGVRTGPDTVVWRAYSMVSGPKDAELEFYSILVPDGEFTPPLSRLGVGDTLLLDKTSYGFLTHDRLVGGQVLWLLATGTGIAPYLSILQERSVWLQYQTIVLVHSVHHPDELAYRSTLEGYAQQPELADQAHKLRYVPVVTGPLAPGQALPGMLSQRITHLLASGELEAATGLSIDNSQARLMVCGNPAFVKETRAWLKQRDIVVGRRGQHGSLVVENFW